MKEKSFKYSDDEYDVVVYVRSATLMDGLTLSTVSQSNGLPPKLTEQDPRTLAITTMLYRLIHPQCMSVTYKIENKPGAKKQLTTQLSVEEFSLLPMNLGQEWISAVYDVNPNWGSVGGESDDKGESIEPSESGSNS